MNGLSYSPSCCLHLYFCPILHQLQLALFLLYNFLCSTVYVLTAPAFSEHSRPCCTSSPLSVKLHRSQLTTSFPQHFSVQSLEEFDCPGQLLAPGHVLRQANLRLAVPRQLPSPGWISIVQNGLPRGALSVGAVGQRVVPGKGCGVAGIWSTWQTYGWRDRWMDGQTVILCSWRSKAWLSKGEREI